ncbi:MAG: M20/M25/M40 family metallo-hydrolase [Spirochaetes bacterium]|nr:M20/M25/M40 family metallo-hydrolase [Spirochaetota bacterium]
MYELLKSRLDYFKDEIIDFTLELIKAESRSLNENKVADLCENKMKELNYDKVFKDQAGNIIGIIYGRKYLKSVLLNSHMDTVPITGESLWEKDPYKPFIDNDKLYGLGSSDCKAGLAMQIYAAAILKNSLLPLDGNIIVAATVAEENGLSVGIKTLISKTLMDLNLKCDYAILGEPTDANIYYGHDGWAQFDIMIDGRDNPVVNTTANQIYNDFSKLNGRFFNKELLNGYENITLKNPEMSNSKHYNKAVVSFLQRINVSDDYNEILHKFNDNTNLLKAPSGVTVQVKVHEEKQKMYNGTNTIIKYIANAWEMNPFNTLVQRAYQALDAVNLKAEIGKWKLKKLGMGTAGNVLFKEYNISTIGYGPGDEKNAHQPNEYVKISNIFDCTYGTILIIHSLIGVPVFGWTVDEI